MTSSRSARASWVRRFDAQNPSLTVEFQKIGPKNTAGFASADSVMFLLDPQRALVMMRPDFDQPLHSWIKGTITEA